MKYVSETLYQHVDHKIFRLLEEESETSNLKEREKNGLAVIDKIKKNFNDFKKSANGQIGKFKEFWEENKKAKEAFTETGDIYKMFNDNYVIGVLRLPVETLSDGSIDGGMGAIDEPEEQIIEGKLINEAEELTENEEDDDLGLGNLDDVFNDEKNNQPASSNKEQSPETSSDIKQTDNLDTNIDSIDTSNSNQQKYFVVYNISGEGREEIFRCGSNNVVNAFIEFYNDIFKGSMKDAILKYNEKKQEEKTKAEKSQKEKVQREKDNKIKKFLGENIIYENLDDTEFIPEDDEDIDDEIGIWFETVHYHLMNDFEFEEEDADNFMLIVDEELEKLYNNDTSPFDAASIISENEEAIEELYKGKEDFEKDNEEDIL